MWWSTYITRTFLFWRLKQPHWNMFLMDCIPPLWWKNQDVMCGFWTTTQRQNNTRNQSLPSPKSWKRLLLKRWIIFFWLTHGSIYVLSDHLMQIFFLLKTSHGDFYRIYLPRSRIFGSIKSCESWHVCINWTQRSQRMIWKTKDF